VRPKTDRTASVPGLKNRSTFSGPIKFVECLSELLGAPGGGAGFDSGLGSHCCFSLYDSVLMKLLGAA